MGEQIDLNKYPIFDALSEDEKAWIASLCRHELYKGGEYIFQEGDEGDCLYLVESGAVKLSKYVSPGYEEMLDYIEEREAFGVICFIEKGKRSSSAVAERDCRLVALPSDHFKEIITRSPRVGYRLFSTLSPLLSNRLRVTNERYKASVLKGLKMCGATAMGLHYVISDKLQIEVKLKNGTLVTGKIMLVARGEAGYELTLKDNKSRLHIIPYHALNHVTGLP